MEKTLSGQQALLEAEKHHRLAQYGEAELLYRKARTAVESAKGVDSPLAQQIAERLARLYLSTAEPEKAGAVLRQLRVSKERSYGAHHPETARIVRKQGEVFALEGRHKESVDYYAHALDIWLDHLGPAPAAKEADIYDFDALYGARSRFGSAQWIFERLKSFPDITPVLLAGQLAELAIALKARGAKGLPLSIFQFACKTLQPLPVEVIWVESAAISETASLLIECERFGEAENFLKGYLDYFDNAFGRDHDLVPEFCRVLARSCQKQLRAPQSEQYYRRALKLQEQTLDRSHPALASTLCDLSSIYLAERDYTQAESLLKRALSIRETTLGYEHLDVAAALCMLGDVYLHNNQLTRAEQSFQRAVRIYEHKFGANSECVGPLLDKIAQGYLDQYKYHKAETILQRSLELKSICLPDDHLDIATISMQLARLYAYWGRPVDAEGYYKRALKILEKPEHSKLVSSYAEALREIAALYKQQCRMLEADKLLRKALELCEDSAISRFEDLPELENELADLYLFTRRLNEADKFANRVIKSCAQLSTSFARIQTSRAYGTRGLSAALKGDPQSARNYLIEALKIAPANTAESLQCQELLIRFCLNRGELADAAHLLERAVEQCLKLKGPDTPAHANLLELEAEIKLANKDFDSVMSIIKRIVNIREVWQGHDHPSHAASRVLLARLYTETGATDYAEESYHKALQNMERSLGPHHTELARTLLLLSLINCKKDKTEDAEALARRALAIWDRVVPPIDITLLNALCDLCANQYLSSTGENRQIVDLLESLVVPTVGAYSGRALHEYCRLLIHLVEQNRAAQARPLFEAVLEALSRSLDTTLGRHCSNILTKLCTTLRVKAPELYESLPPDLKSKGQ